MIPEVAAKLLDVNRQFYQTFATQFSRTRQRLQPGVRRVIDAIPLTACVLDLGCGNGELDHALAQRGFQGIYVGLDFSAEMLAQARERRAAWQGEVAAGGFHSVFQQTDLAIPGWEDVLHTDKNLPAAYDFVLAFAVLHHLPGAEIRRMVIRAIRRLLKPGGKLIHSNWQFLNSPRLRERIQPWEKIGLSVEEVDPGDYLLDWKEGGYGLRYVHHFTPEELHSLAQENGFIIEESFLSDGKEGNLSLYQIWTIFP